MLLGRFLRANCDTVCFQGIILENNDRAEAFVEQCEELIGGTDKEPAAKRQKTRGKAEPIPDTSWRAIKRADIAQCIAQIYLGDVEEVTHISYTVQSSVQPNADLDVDSDDEDGAVPSQAVDASDSLLYRLSAKRMFDHASQQWKMEQWGTNETMRELETYSSGGQFTIAAAELCNFQVLRNAGGGGWLLCADVLDNFLLPDVKPTVGDMRKYLVSLTHLGGGQTAAVHMLDDEEVSDSIGRLLPPTHMNPNQPIVRSATPIAGLSWSDTTVAMCLPTQNHAVSYWSMLRDKAHVAFQAGKLDSTLLQWLDEQIIEYIDILFAAGQVTPGLPASYGRVRAAFNQDRAAFAQVVGGPNKRVAETLLSCYFPPAPPDDMSHQTLFIYQLHDFLQVEAGLNAQQTLIAAAVFSMSFIVDHPGFGNPCSIQAEGPPGLGKSYIQKVMVEMINTGKVLKCNSYSSQAMTYEGMEEQCLLLMDENVNQGVKGGQTGQRQSSMIDGTLSRARADAEAKRTEIFSVACRYVEFAASNYELNNAMKKRYVCLPVTGDGKTAEKSFTQKTPAYVTACVGWKLVTGLTTFPYLYKMFRLVECSMDLYDIFAELHAHVYPDSMLKQILRVKESIGVMAKSTTLMALVSLYHRRHRGAVAEVNTIALLQWLQVNWICDPYCIWFAAQCQLAGNDPNRNYKILSWLKNNLKKQAGGSIDFCENEPDYYITTFEINDARMEAQADLIGLGLAILKEGLRDMSLKKGAAPPAVISYQVNRSTHYCVHRNKVTSMKTLTVAEQVIVDLLISKMAQATANADLTHWVFPRSVRNKISQPDERIEGLANVSETEVDTALRELETSLGITMYTGTGTMRGTSERRDEVCVIDNIRLNTSKKAPPGSMLDQDYTDNVYYTDGRILAGGIVFDAKKMHEYLEIQAGRDPALIEAKERSAELANLFFTACGVSEGSQIFNGVGKNGEIAEWHDVEVPEKSPMIRNPYYTGGRGRLSSFSQAAADNTHIFKSNEKKVKISPDLKLAKRVIDKRCQALYFDTKEIEKLWA